MSIVAPLLTVTTVDPSAVLVPLGPLPSRLRIRPPAETVVGPASVPASLRVRVPLPALLRLPGPLMAPEKEKLLAFPRTRELPVPMVTLMPGTVLVSEPMMIGDD